MHYSELEGEMRPHSLDTRVLVGLPDKHRESTKTSDRECHEHRVKKQHEDITAFNERRQSPQEEDPKIKTFFVYLKKSRK